MPITTCIFDAYGTLFDVNAAAREAAEQPGNEQLAEVWPKLAADWRRKQLEYSWLRAVAREHVDFWQVTKDGLDWALEAVGIENPQMREMLLALYWELSAYPEVPQMLADLKKRGIHSGILSNGSPDMLDGAVSSAGLADLLDAVLSVEDVHVFKPHDLVYEMVEMRFISKRDEVLFVSSNGWDAASAARFGFQTAWVNRGGDPMDRLYAKPHHVLSDLSSIPDLL